MPESLVIDTSSLVALERAELDEGLGRLPLRVVVPEEVREEFGREPGWMEVEFLRGKSVSKVEELVEMGLDRREAECLVLAKREGMDYVVSDDRKLIRQRKVSGDEYLRSVTVLGFSFPLHLLREEGEVEDVWSRFREIVEENGWTRSEVYVANYTFLKEMGY